MSKFCIPRVPLAYSIECVYLGLDGVDPSRVMQGCRRRRPRCILYTCNLWWLSDKGRGEMSTKSGSAATSITYQRPATNDGSAAAVWQRQGRCGSGRGRRCPKSRRCRLVLVFAACGDGDRTAAWQIDGGGREDCEMALFAIIGRAVAEEWPGSGGVHGCDIFFVVRGCVRTVSDELVSFFWFSLVKTPITSSSRLVGEGQTSPVHVTDITSHHTVITPSRIT